MSGAAGTPAGIGPAGDVATDRSARIAIAIVAMGGQGGGVLSDWIVALAESNGWLAQNTSVPGVAQRTGATVYYIELFDASRAQGLAPVLALMPTSGDVDLVVAAELMEAGRAIQRGFVTPDRTTLIASSHRAYATVEKIVPGDGRADAAGVHEAARVAARRYLVDDMAALAERHGSVISASLFGAIAASGALPFPRAAFEAAIRAGGVGVEASLAAFGAGFRAADRPSSAGGEQLGDATGNRPGLPPLRDDDSLHARVRAGLPESVHALAALGVDRQREYLDEAYADEYLQRLVRVAGSLADVPAHAADAVLAEVARWLALWMSYEDVYRVAEYKTRASRIAELRALVGAAVDDPVGTLEFLHPRVEEIADALPRRWGERLLASKRLRTLVDRWFARGRRLDTSTLRGFLPLWLLATQGRQRRRGSLRHAREQAAIGSWLDRLERLAARDPALALEYARCARLLKGYGDTYARGRERFEALGVLAERLVGSDASSQAAARLARVREAALADADPVAFERQLQVAEATPVGVAQAG